MSEQPEVIPDCGKPDFPRHVAIIMDGNGRWAEARSLPRSAGHWQGVEAVRRTIRAAAEMGIEYLTLYSFSSENWTRPASEVDYLLGLLRRFVQTDVAELHKNDVRVRIIGDREGLAEDLRSLIDQTEALTRGNTSLTLVVAFNYGSQDELMRAARRAAEAVRDGRLAPEDLTIESFAGFLDTDGIPNPDLVIRTSGEKRLSNFLLWQSAYSELVFVDEYWPEFDRQVLERAIEQYLNRSRRFGGLAASVGA